jgi:hypothetical protein
MLYQLSYLGILNYQNLLAMLSAKTAYLGILNYQNLLAMLSAKTAYLGITKRYYTI